MTCTAGKDALAKALNRWHGKGHSLNLFLRDDDAIEPSPQLDQLVRFAKAKNIPALLAIIPKYANIELANYLLSQPLLTPAVHGYAHANYAGENEKKQELSNHRDIETVLLELGTGREKLNAWFGNNLSKIFVPPWNRVAPEIAEKLSTIGFTAVSGFAGNLAGAKVNTINTHVDIIDWKDGGRGKATDRVFEELADVMDWARKSEYRLPIGILSHHLVHDAKCWNALDALADFLRNYKFVQWVKPDDFI